MLREITLPVDLYRSLLDGQANALADRHLRRVLDGKPRLWLEDTLGRVLAWQWQWDETDAVRALASYMVALDGHPIAAELDAPITLAEVLQGLDHCLLPGFTAAERARLQQAARVGVPRYYAAVR